MTDFGLPMLAPPRVAVPVASRSEVFQQVAMTQTALWLAGTVTATVAEAAALVAILPRKLKVGIAQPQTAM
jgi:hypothetical protein